MKTYPAFSGFLKIVYGLTTLVRIIFTFETQSI